MVRPYQMPKRGRINKRPAARAVEERPARSSLEPTPSTSGSRNTPSRRRRKFKPPQPKDLEDSDRFFVIEKLLDKRLNRNGFEEYLVRWENYPPEFDSWEPKIELQLNAQDMIDHFEFGPSDNEEAANSANDDNILHCTCKRKYKKDGAMIQCLKCLIWYHFKCVGIDIQEANMYATYFCSDCRKNDPDLRSMIKEEKLNTIPGKLLVERKAKETK